MSLLANQKNMKVLPFLFFGSKFILPQEWIYYKHDMHKIFGPYLVEAQKQKKQVLFTTLQQTAFSGWENVSICHSYLTKNIYSISLSGSGKIPPEGIMFYALRESLASTSIKGNFDRGDLQSSHMGFAICPLKD